MARRKERLDPTAEFLAASDPLDEENDAIAYFRNLYRPRRRIQRRTIVVLGVAIAAILLVLIDGFYVMFGLRSALLDTADFLRKGEQAIVDGKLGVATSSFDGAARRAEDARSLARRPSLFLASFVPVLGDDARVLSALPEVGQLTAEAGIVATDAAVRLGATSRGRLAASLYDDGRVQFQTIEAGRQLITRTSDLFERAEQRLAELPQPHSDTLRNGLADARARVNTALDITTRAETLLGALPRMMGSESPRRYLVAFQAPSEAKASGGLIGLYGVLEVREGRSELLHIGPFVELTTGIDPEELQLAQPTSLAAAQDLQRKAEILQAALNKPSVVNTSPSFPQVARRLLGIYRVATGRVLDGVFAVDPIALGHLVKATGPLHGEGLSKPITPDNATKMILLTSYLRFSEDPIAQNAFLQSVIQDFWTKLGSGAVDASALAEAFGAGSRGMHLKIYARDPSEQAALREFGMDGDFADSGPNVQFVYHNNLAQNKVDYYLDREISTDIEITPDEYALVTTRVVLRNQAPAILPHGLQSPTYESTGINHMELGIVMPQGSTFESMRVNGRAVLATRETEGAFPIATERVKIPPGSTATARISYRIPDATDLLRGGMFRFNLFPQGSVIPDRYKVTIRPPVGFKITSTSPELVESSSFEVGFEGVLDKEVGLVVEISPFR